ncbi:MAG: hypothetical protein WCT77_03620 [Bacteroidota bacterium]
MNTITLLKQKIGYWNQKFNEVDEVSNQPEIVQTFLKQQNLDINLKVKGLINLHLIDMEDILTNVKKEFAQNCNLKHECSNGA